MGLTDNFKNVTPSYDVTAFKPTQESNNFTLYIIIAAFDNGCHSFVEIWLCDSKIFWKKILKDFNLCFKTKKMFLFSHIYFCSIIKWFILVLFLKHKFVIFYPHYFYFINQKTENWEKDLDILSVHGIGACLLCIGLVTFGCIEIIV